MNLNKKQKMMHYWASVFQGNINSRQTEACISPKLQFDNFFGALNIRQITACDVHSVNFEPLLTN